MESELIIEFVQMRSFEPNSFASVELLYMLLRMLYFFLQFCALIVCYQHFRAVTTRPNIKSKNKGDPISNR